MIEINRQGITRIVFLTRRYAFKVPNFMYGYRFFLRGLLANLQEKDVYGWAYRKVDLCPVRFAFPLGLLVVMPRVRVMTDAEFLKFDYQEWSERAGRYITVEDKESSFGWLDGRVVAIDYGD